MRSAREEREGFNFKKPNGRAGSCTTRPLPRARSRFRTPLGSLWRSLRSRSPFIQSAKERRATPDRPRALAVDQKAEWSDRRGRKGRRQRQSGVVVVGHRVKFVSAIARGDERKEGRKEGRTKKPPSRPPNSAGWTNNINSNKRTALQFEKV